MSTSWWLFTIAVVYGVLVTLFWLMRNPLPFPDRGHRCFAVPNEKAAKVVTGILGEIGRLPERFTFDPLPTHQTLLWDNATVIMQFNQSIREQGLAKPAISVVVRDPTQSANEAAAILKQQGFTAEVKGDVLSGMGSNLALLTSNAFDGWVMIFRRHLLAMGKPPNKHKLLS